jgi:hypothetical protein
MDSRLGHLKLTLRTIRNSQGHGLESLLFAMLAECGLQTGFEFAGQQVNLRFVDDVSMMTAHFVDFYLRR